MIRKLLTTLKERPILSIIICMLLAEGIQLLVLFVSGESPSFHYGFAVIALLVLFMTPFMLSRQNDNKKEPQDKVDDEKK